MQNCNKVGDDKITNHIPIGRYIQRFFINTLYGVGGRLIQLFIGIYMVGYIVSRLGIERWGLVVFAMTVASFLSLIQLGAASGMSKKFNEFLTRGEIERFKGHYTAGVLLCVVLGIITTVATLLILFIFWPRFELPHELTSEGKLVFAAIGAMIVFNSLSLVYVACLQAMHRIDVNEKIQTLGLLIRSATVVILFETIGPSAVAYASILVCASIFILFCQWLWVRMNIIDARTDLRLINLSLIWNVVSFNILSLFDTLNYLIFMQFPALLLRKHIALVGLYGINLQINNLLRGFLMSGSSALFPIMVSLKSSEKMEALRSLFCIATKTFMSISVMIWVWFYLLGPDILIYWFSEKLDISELLLALPYLMVVLASGVAAMPIASVAVALERINITAIVGCALTIAMMISSIVIFRFEIVHPLTTISMILAVFFCLYQFLRLVIVGYALELSLKKIMLDLILRSAIPAIITGILLSTLSNHVITNNIFYLVLLTAMSGALYAITVWGLVYNNTEKKKVWTIMSHFYRTANV